MGAQPGLRPPFPQLQTPPEEWSPITATLGSVMHGGTLTGASSEATLPTCQATHPLESNHPLAFPSCPKLPTGERAQDP